MSIRRPQPSFSGPRGYFDLLTPESLRQGNFATYALAMPGVAPSPPPPSLALPLPLAERRVERMVLQAVHLEFDTSRLTPLGRRVLDETAQKLQENPHRSVEIEGYTDAIGPPGFHLGLGKRCAEVGKGSPAWQQRIDPQRMISLSYGEARAFADIPAQQGRAVNRRVEFSVLLR
jgi:OmpA-OmpF porin, OOP family